MAIADDIGIDKTNKRIYYQGSGATYTGEELYLYLQDQADELSFTLKWPIDYQTDQSYIIPYGWWYDIGEGSRIFNYLKGAAFKTLGYDTTVYDMGVRLLKLATSGWHTITAGDIGTTVAYLGGSPT
ncbi:MAG: hypothetical protein ABIK28_25205, partial [Planctomycetota bacterium]